jgi:hypothetical protein
MAFGQVVSKMVDFLRAGLPPGAPSTGYIPALALFPRSASDDELGLLASHFGPSGNFAITSTDIGVALTRLLGALPSPHDIQRASRRLVADGWTVS